MDQGTKTALLIIGGLFLAFGLAVVGAGWWLSENWSSLADEMMESLEQAEADASAYAEGHEQKECLDEAHRQAAECGAVAVTCNAKVGVFFSICLNKARPTPGLCKDVPPVDSDVKSTLWPAQQCRDRGWQNEAACSGIFQGLRDYCQAQQHVYSK